MVPQGLITDGRPYHHCDQMEPVPAVCPQTRYFFQFLDILALVSVKNAIGWLVHRVRRRVLSIGRVTERVG